MAQATKKIVVEHSDFFAVNQIEAPDAALLTGNVRMIHDGVVMTCNKAYFFEKENGGILLTDEGRRNFISIWQEKKKEMITYPFLQEKVEWGLVPYVQAMLLARYVRGDIDAYPAFIWK